MIYYKLELILSNIKTIGSNGIDFVRMLTKHGVTLEDSFNSFNELLTCNSTKIEIIDTGNFFHGLKTWGIHANIL